MQKVNVHKWLCRWSPTLGSLEGTAQEIWGTEEYEMWEKDCLGQDFSKFPAVFFGLYGLPDFYKLWRHKGRRCILWAGTDILHFKKGYWLEEGGGIRMSSRSLATWINKHCESYVENEVEAEALLDLGIVSKMVPSFLGDVNDFPVCYKPEKKIRLYTSVSGDNFEQYGWYKIAALAQENPNIEFHLYGNKEKYSEWEWPNVIVHGRVPKEQMNAETKEMTGALRLTEFDGFSEIIAKSLLWGQWPVSVIEYPHTLKPENIDMLKIAREPNTKGREWLLSVVNKYPWNPKQ